MTTARMSWALCAGLCILLATVSLSQAQTTGPATQPAAASKPAVWDVEKNPTVTVSLGSSQVVKSPWPVAKVSITMPEVADVQVLTPRQVLVLGKGVGTTDLVLWGKEEDQAWRSKVEVSADIRRLREDLLLLFPGCALDLAASGNLVVVSGKIAQAEQAAQIGKFLDTRGVKYLNMTRLAGVSQVQIQIRIAEVSRQATRALGMDFFKTGHDMFGGSRIGFGPQSSVNFGVPAGTPANLAKPPFVVPEGGISAPGNTTVLFGFPEWGLEFFLEALRDNQYLRILAEPTLVALSGEEAQFLAGGEFPVPVIQSAGSSSGTGNAITIEYKEFGVRLRFRPTVMGDGSIRLRVSPEVSQIGGAGSVSFGGFSVPAVQTRKAETTLELKSGQSFAMAGLISHSDVANVTRVLGLGDLPVLGSLFRSVRYVSQETELVVLAKVSLVSPSDGPTPPVPGVLQTLPNDWELFAEGRIEGRTPARISPTDAAWFKDMGLNQLHGVGAWANYDESAPVSRAELRPSPAAVEPGTQPATQP